MDKLFYKKLITSFLEPEKKDFNAICGIIDSFSRGFNVAVISDDPYLLTLIFGSLMRYYGKKINILNPAEGTEELQRLLYVINPNYVILTDENLLLELHNFKKLLINGDTISREVNDDVDEPEELNFSIVSYTSSPTKVYTMSSDMFIVMTNAFVEDLLKFKLVSWMDFGLIPFISTNSDYLLYFVAIKIAYCNISTEGTCLLPTKEEYSIAMENRKWYLKLSKHKTLFIPKKEFLEYWEKDISSIYEHKFIFKSYFKRPWLTNLLIKRRLKKLFNGFTNVLIIGIIDNSFIIEFLKNLSFIKFYSIFPIQSTLMFGPISKSLDSIVLSSNEYRQDTLTPMLDSNYTLNFKLFHPNNKTIYSIVDIHNRFAEGETIEEDGYNKKQYFPLGNINNSFDGVFPETLERVINSYPFVKNSALLTFANKLILIINPNMDLLDANKINFEMFNGIIQQQIDTLNKILPESYKIQGFVISTSLIEQDRNGNIVRYPFNYCNKWSE